MKNIKEITISIFAIIGFFTIITGFTNNTETATQQTYGTPESHVWELVGVEGRAFAINKVTGEGKLFVRFAKTSGTTTGLKAYTARDLKYGENPKN